MVPRLKMATILRKQDTNVTLVTVVSALADFAEAVDSDSIEGARG